MYPALKHTHALLAVISILLFQYRYWAFAVKARQPGKFYKITPHVIDTLLLITGITVAAMVSFTMANSPWLTTKVVALFFYVGFGVLAMRGRGQMRWVGYLLATLTFIYIVAVAVTKNPTFFL
ncbi:MAG: hypothetical protein DWP95_13160 [Proteobacteria bacterium]|nr:MAG: hypothetical protein DWP95_13160 [Pseudomonadota bacterium]